MNITILSATKEQGTSKTGKAYSFLELAYKGEDGKVAGRKIMSFGDSKGVFDVLSKAQSGEVYDIQMVKNEGTGYWDWTSAKKSDGNFTTSSEVASSSQVGQKTGAGGKVLGSNYETPEERARKQVYIVRQSSITAALSYLAGTQNTGFGINDVIDIAKDFEEYVFSTGSIAATEFKGDEDLVL